MWRIFFCLAKRGSNADLRTKACTASCARISVRSSVALPFKKGRKVGTESVALHCFCFGLVSPARTLCLPDSATLAAIDGDSSLDLVLHAGDLSYADCDHVRDGEPRAIQSSLVRAMLCVDAVVEESPCLLHVYAVTGLPLGRPVGATGGYTVFCMRVSGWRSRKLPLWSYSLVIATAFVVFSFFKIKLAVVTSLLSSAPFSFWFAQCDLTHHTNQSLTRTHTASLGLLHADARPRGEPPSVDGGRREP